MSLLCDHDIRRRSTNSVYHGGKPMIEPFSEAVSGGNVISYGLTSAGYDLRLGPEILVFKNSYGEAIEPKRFNDPDYRSRMFDEIKFAWPPPEGITRQVVIPPHGYILGRSLEYLRIPRDLKARCVGKSSLARSGILVNTTPAEPEWEGYLTIEIGNITPCQAVIYVGEGIAQMEFETLSGPVEVSYKDKGGIYDRQTGVTPTRTRQ